MLTLTFTVMGGSPFISPGNGEMPLADCLRLPAYGIPVASSRPTSAGVDLTQPGHRPHFSGWAYTFRLRRGDFLVGSSAKERPMGSKRPGRREFLKGGAAVAGGFTLGAVAPAIGQTPASP